MLEFGMVTFPSYVFFIQGDDETTHKEFRVPRKSTVVLPLLSH